MFYFLYSVSCTLKYGNSFSLFLHPSTIPAYPALYQEGPGSNTSWTGCQSITGLQRLSKENEKMHNRFFIFYL